MSAPVRTEDVAVVGAAHGLAVPGELSVIEAKRALFAADPWFRDGWEDLVRLAPPGGAAAVAHDHALVLLKPDAVARRLLHLALDWFSDRRAEVVASAVVQLDRQSLRAMWQYQLNASTRDRRDLADAICAASPSLLLILRLPSAPLPATVRVSAMKGPADPARRAPGQFRAALGGGNFLLNFIHAADEPADLARELSILLEPAARDDVIRQLVEGDAVLGEEAARGLATQLEASTEAHDLDFGAALNRLELGLAAVAGLASSDTQEAARGEATAGLLALRLGEPANWRDLLSALDEAGAPAGPWDAIVIGTRLMDHSEPDVEQLLGSAARAWSGTEVAA